MWHCVSIALTVAHELAVAIHSFKLNDMMRNVDTYSVTA